jgi:hypothetical protein
MKIFITLCIGVLILSSCGKKSDPKYQGKIEQIKVII